MGGEVAYVMVPTVARWWFGADARMDWGDATGPADQEGVGLIDGSGGAGTGHPRTMTTPVIWGWREQKYS